MATPLRGEDERLPPQDAESDRASIDAAEYARTVGNRVAELVEQALERAPGSVEADPESMAQLIFDVVINRLPDPDRSELAELVAPLWTAEHTRHLLKLSRRAMSSREQARSLLALETADGDLYYPVSQFERHDGEIRVKPALQAFMQAMPDRDPWTIAVLVNTPADELDSSTPLDWVRGGGDTQVLLDLAVVLNAEFAR